MIAGAVLGLPKIGPLKVRSIVLFYSFVFPFAAVVAADIEIGCRRRWQSRLRLFYPLQRSRDWTVQRESLLARRNAAAKVVIADSSSSISASSGFSSTIGSGTGA